MTSPIDEITAPASLGPAHHEAFTPAALENDAFGPDEERLVQMAHLEASLRLARAL